MSLSFYRKYRPQKVSDLDLESVRQFFERILASGKVAHAYLFAGPKGTGKTSAARILAKIVNCRRNVGKKGKWQEPDGKCQMCQAITLGTAVDLLEIDAASNRGIDDVRRLREFIRLTPAEATIKVFIIDEVHMLTTEAFNALLKTLEEPPGHCLFILCTTEPQKLPETVVSRCVRLNFNKAKPGEVKRSLKTVIKKEKLKINPDAVEFLANSVDGSFRDAKKVLEQVSLSKRRITKEMMAAELGRAGAMDETAFLADLVDGKVRETMAWVERASEQGVDLVLVVKKLLEFLQEAVHILAGVVDGKENRLAAELGTKLGVKGVVELIGRLDGAGREIKVSLEPKLPLKVMVLEWCLEKKGELRGADERGSDGKMEARLKQPGSAPPTRHTAAKGEADLERGEGTSSLKSLAGGSSKKVVKEERTSGQNQTGSVKRGEMVERGGGLVLEQVEKAWSEVLAKVKPLNHSLEALLHACRPRHCEGDWLVVEVYYQFHKEQLEQERFRQMVEGVVSDLLARKLKLRYVLGERPKQTIKEERIAETLGDNEVVKIAEEVFAEE